MGMKRGKVVEEDFVGEYVGIFAIDGFHAKQCEVAFIFFWRSDLASDGGAGAKTEASDLAGADVDIVGAWEVVVVGAAQEAEAIGEDFEGSFAEHESVETGAFFEDAEDEILFFEPMDFGELILFGDGDQVFHGHALEFSDIDPVFFRWGECFGDRFAVLCGVIAAV